MTSHTARAVTAFLWLASAICVTAQPAVLTDPARLRPPRFAEYALWGESVALGRDFALVAASRDTVGPPLVPPPLMPGNRNGSVTVFEPRAGAWMPTARLVGRSGTGSDEDLQEFGFSVAALDLASGGSIAVVGSPKWNADLEDGPAAVQRHVGRAYVFRKNALTGRWTEEATLRADQPRAFENVGHGVAVADTKFGLVVVTGAPGYTMPGGPAGRAYVHTRDPATGVWTQEAILDGCLPRGTYEQYLLGSLGEEVAVTATASRVVVALVGSATLNGEFVSAGCIFSREDTGSSPGLWTLDETIPSYPAEFVGSSNVSVVAASDISGGTVVMLGFAREARALVYERSDGEQAWTRRAELTGGPDAYGFGRSSSLIWTTGGYLLLVGATADQTFGPSYGAGHLFQRAAGKQAWEPVALLGPPEALNYLYLGSSVALGAGGQAMASAPFHRTENDGDGEGRAYLYDVSALFPVATEAPAEVPASGRLAVAGSNPARGAAAVSFALVEAGEADVRVYDGLGREVARVASGTRGEGVTREVFSVSGWAPGVYVVRLVAGARRETVRLVVAR